jgi:hypothetical protein
MCSLKHNIVNAIPTVISMSAVKNVCCANVLARVTSRKRGEAEQFARVAEDKIQCRPA